MSHHEGSHSSEFACTSAVRQVARTHVQAPSRILARAVARIDYFAVVHAQWLAPTILYSSHLQDANCALEGYAVEI
jgi:hypothetical protein